MPSKKLKTPLLPDTYYHIYNRGNNREKVFFADDDYEFFLAKYRMFIGPFGDTFAYCLLPNQFHFVIRTQLETNKISIVSNQLRKLFITYARRINTRESRSGSLFTKNFQRVEIKDENHLLSVVRHIHRIPKRQGLELSFQKYRYSSFTIYMNPNGSFVRTQEVIHSYGGLEAFLESHISEERDLLCDHQEYFE